MAQPLPVDETLCFREKHEIDPLQNWFPGGAAGAALRIVEGTVKEGVMLN